MRPISRLVPRQASPFPAVCCRTTPSSHLKIWPVTGLSTPPRRHKSQARQTAGPGLSTSEATPAVRTFKPRGTFSDVESPVFTHANVPPLSFWQLQLPHLGPEDLTATQCLQAARLYCDGTPRRDAVWARRLLAANPGDVTPYLLHYLGVMLIYGPPSSSNIAAEIERQRNQLGWNMLVTAHELGYDPSSLQLVIEDEQHHQQHQQHASATRGPGFRPTAPVRAAVARHQALVRAGRDPSALALHAAQLRSAGVDRQRAEDAFIRAYQAGIATAAPAAAPALPPSEHPPSSSPSPSPPPRRPRWLYEAACRIAYGARMLEQGQRDEAEAAVRPAALELDSADAYAALAKIAADPGERTEFTLRAAVAGMPSACEGMAKVEARRATADGVGEEERRMRVLIGREWALLGRDEMSLGPV